jgi:hypothetical protein
VNGTDRDVERARENASRARARLANTMSEILDRLHPRTLVNEAIQEVRERGQEIAGQAVELARARPAATSAIAAGVIALFARAPIRRAVTALAARWRHAPEAEDTAKPEDRPLPVSGKIPHRYEEVA